MVDHAAARGVVAPTDDLLRLRDSRPLAPAATTTPGSASVTSPLIAAQHPAGFANTLTWVERHFGYGIARADAGHTESTGPATALSSMTGQPHPRPALNRPHSPMAVYS